jgi:hypothetical protein
MTEGANNRLGQFLNEGRNWERKATNISGVFLFRLPASKGRPASLAIEINPVDTYGSVTKKRGIIIRSSSELDEISRLLRHTKVGELSPPSGCSNYFCVYEILKGRIKPPIRLYLFPSFIYCSSLKCISHPLDIVSSLGQLRDFVFAFLRYPNLLL